MGCAKLLTMAAITFTWANADFDRRHSTSEIGQSLPNFTIRNISVRPPIADIEQTSPVDVLGPQATNWRHSALRGHLDSWDGLLPHGNVWTDRDR